MRILLVEDDRPIAHVIQRGLEGARYQVEAVEDGTEGLRRALRGQFDLVILDLMLPGMDGFEICAELRERRYQTPILILTARDGVDDRIRGIDLGADDYLAKPFNFGELLARVHALLRRDCVHKARVIRIADLEVDTTAGRARRGGRELDLSRREFALLESLAAYEGRALHAEWLRHRIPAAPPATAQDAELDQELSRLSDKIDSGCDWKLIAAVGNNSYTLRGPRSVGASV